MVELINTRKAFSQFAEFYYNVEFYQKKAKHQFLPSIACHQNLLVHKEVKAIQIQDGIAVARSLASIRSSVAKGQVDKLML